jgi:hypothetical protein
MGAVQGVGKTISIDDPGTNRSNDDHYGSDRRRNAGVWKRNHQRRRRDRVIGQAQWAIKAALLVAISTEFRAGASLDHLSGGEGSGLLCPASSTGHRAVHMARQKR